MSTTLKSVVIIGGCSGGATVARSLEKTLPSDHRLVLIEANEFAYWPPGALRASVEPGFEKQVFATFDGFFGVDSRHVVLAGYTVKEVTDNSVKLDRPAPAPFDSDSIPIEAGIISIGSLYSLPMRPMSSKLSEAQEGLRKMQTEVAKARHILIVGGGPVGIEFAGEVLQQHPDKKVTLVHATDALMKEFRAPLGKKLLSQLQSRNVDVRLNTSIDLTEEHISRSQRLVEEGLSIKLNDGSELSTDFLFIGTGGKPNTSLVPQDALDDGTPKRINVNASTLRLTHPSLGKKWFALGDASNAPGSKTHLAAAAQAPIVAAQLTALVSGSSSSKAYKEPSSIMSVPIGKSGGATQIMWPVLGEWFTALAKGKTLFISTFLASYPGGIA